MQSNSKSFVRSATARLLTISTLAGLSLTTIAAAQMNGPGGQGVPAQVRAAA